LNINPISTQYRLGRQMPNIPGRHTVQKWSKMWLRAGLTTDFRKIRRGAVIRPACSHILSGLHCGVRLFLSMLPPRNHQGTARATFPNDKRWKIERKTGRRLVWLWHTSGLWPTPDKCQLRTSFLLDYPICAVTCKIFCF
jgi:hypothetical protein